MALYKLVFDFNQWKLGEGNRRAYYSLHFMMHNLHSQTRFLFYSFKMFVHCHDCLVFFNRPAICVEWLSCKAVFGILGKGRMSMALRGVQATGVIWKRIQWMCIKLWLCSKRVLKFTKTIWLCFLWILGRHLVWINSLIMVIIIYLLLVHLESVTSEAAVCISMYKVVNVFLGLFIFVQIALSFYSFNQIACLIELHAWPSYVLWLLIFYDAM